MAFKRGRGIELVFKKGNGASPEVFTAFCSLTAKSISHQGTENTFAIPNCENPDEVSWLVSEMQDKRITFTGSGMLNTPDYDEFYDWWDSGESSNAQVIIDVPSADGGRILEGLFKVPSFDLTGNKGEMMQVSITAASDGPVVKTNNT